MKRNFNSFKDEENIEYLVNKTNLDKLNCSKDIQSFNGGKVNIYAKKTNEILTVAIKGTIDLNLISAYSFKPFKTSVEIEDTFYFTNDEIYESDEVILIKNSINFDEIIYSLVLVSIPINPYKEGEDTTSIGGIEILKEEDLKLNNSPLADKLDELLKDSE